MVMLRGRSVSRKYFQQLIRLAKKLARRTHPLHIVAAVFVLAGGITLGRTQMPLTTWIMSQDAVPRIGPLKIRLNQDVAPGYTANIYPEIKGDWELHKTPLGVYEAIFTPSEQVQPGYSCAVKLTGLKRALTGRSI